MIGEQSGAPGELQLLAGLSRSGIGRETPGHRVQNGLGLVDGQLSGLFGQLGDSGKAPADETA